MRHLGLAVCFLVLAWQVQSFVITTSSSKFIHAKDTIRHMTNLVYNGKKKDFKPGTPLSKACATLGVPVKYSCKKGDCATCQINLAGRYVRACTGKVPEEPRLKSLIEKGLEIKV